MAILRTGQLWTKCFIKWKKFSKILSYIACTGNAGKHLDFSVPFSTVMIMMVLPVCNFSAVFFKTSHGKKTATWRTWIWNQVDGLPARVLADSEAAGSTARLCQDTANLPGCYGPSGSGRVGTRSVTCIPDKPINRLPVSLRPDSDSWLGVINLTQWNCHGVPGRAATWR